MTSVIDNQQTKEKCQTFTPPEVVERLLDLANYKDDLFGKKLLECSCGNGFILKQVVRRYIESCKRKRLKTATIKAGLEKDIVAYEIDSVLIKECIKDLDKVAAGFKILNVSWNITCKDFLAIPAAPTYDYIIGNPPYISYHDLPSDVRLFVKGNFSCCKKGKFDYSYAFVEQSYNFLSNGGVLSYIVPGYLLKNVFAADIRNLIKDDLQQIIEFPNKRVFPGVLVSPAIISVCKGSKSNKLVYEDGTQKSFLDKAQLKGKWIFEAGDVSTGSRIGDYYKVSSCIATLLNKAFLVQGTWEGDCLRVGNYLIEREIIKKATSPKSKRRNAENEYIIFPYHYSQDNKLIRYQPEEFEKQFPNATEYLQSFFTELSERKSDKTAAWFEYGRSQAIQHMNQEKLLISSVISSCTKAYLLGADVVPYSGLYIVSKSDKTLSRLLHILASERFKKYILKAGVAVNGTSRRITPSDIENFVCNL